MRANSLWLLLISIGLCLAVLLSAQEPAVYQGKVAETVDGVEMVAQICDNGVEVNWMVEGEKDVVTYELQRSGPDLEFSPIAWIDANAQDLYHEYYHYIDIPQMHGILYYRVAILDYNGFCEYSDPIMIELDVTQILALSVSPHTATGNELTVSVTGLRAPIKGWLGLFGPDNDPVYMEEVQFCEGDLHHIFIPDKVSGPYTLKFRTDRVELRTSIMSIEAQGQLN